MFLAARNVLPYVHCGFSSGGVVTVVIVVVAVFIKPLQVYVRSCYQCVMAHTSQGASD